MVAVIGPSCGPRWLYSQSLGAVVHPDCWASPKRARLPRSHTAPRVRADYILALQNAVIWVLRFFVQGRRFSIFQDSGAVTRCHRIALAPSYTMSNVGSTSVLTIYVTPS